MKRTRFSATYYNWKAKYGGLAVSDVQKLKRLEDGEFPVRVRDFG